MTTLELQTTEGGHFMVRKITTLALSSMLILALIGSGRAVAEEAVTSEPEATPVPTIYEAETEPEEAQPPEPQPLPPPENLTPPVQTEGMAALPAIAQPVITLERLNEALVEYRSAWERGIGFLVGDQHTVVVVGDLRDRHRRITARMAGGGGDRPEVNVANVRVQTNQRFRSFVVLHLEEDLPGQPLEISPLQPALGDTVVILHRLGDQMGNRVPNEIELAHSTITSSSRYTFTVGAAWNQIWRGSPVFDVHGALIAFHGNGGFALRVSELIAEVNSQPQRQLISPVVGLRLGTEFGGFLDNPLTVEIELGIAIWDQLGINFFFGGGMNTQESLVLIPANALHEEGVAQGDHTTMFLGLEVEYRLMLTRGAVPFYLDFSFGLQYTMSMLDLTGPAFYATDPACDPMGGDCGLTIGEPPNRDVVHSVGLSLGVDLRAGPFVIGYRFIPEGASYQGINTHRLNVGISWR
jgi:hypothetical protein